MNLLIRPGTSLRLRIHLAPELQSGSRCAHASGAVLHTLTLACLLALPTQLRAAQGCVPGRIETKTAATFRGKIGFEENLLDPLRVNSPVRLYLRKTVETRYNFTNPAGITGHFLTTERYEAHRSSARPGGEWRFGCQRWQADVNANYEGTGSYANGSDACSATQHPDGTWSNPICWQRIQDLPDCPFGITSQTPTSLIEDGERTTAAHTIRFHRETTLEEEYTTEHLRQDLLDSFPPYPATWTSATAEASLQLSGYHGCALAHRMKYRFKFQGERDVSYRIEWDEVTIQSNGDQTVVHLEEIVEGAGGLTYSSEHECPPPEWNGGLEDGSAYTVVTGLAISVEDDPPPDSLPGNGGASMQAGGGAADCEGCRAPSGGRAGAVNVSFSMGRAAGGRPAGALRLLAREAGPALGTPVLLRFNTRRDDVEVITLNGQIRQVKGPLALADVVVVPNQGYEIRYYLVPVQGFAKVGGLYQVFGEPYVVWRVAYGVVTILGFQGTQEPGDELIVEEVRDGTARTWIYQYARSSKTWTLQHPGDLRYDEGRRIRENGWMVERLITRASKTGPELYRTERKYGLHPSGNLERVEESIGAGADTQTTRHTYADQGVFDGTITPVQQTVHPDGSWERFSYDPQGRVFERVIGFGDAPPGAPPDECRVIRSDFDPTAVALSGDDGSLEPDTARRVDEWVKGVLVSTRYTVILPGERRDIVCLVPGALWSDPANLVTVTRHFTSGPDGGKIQSVRRPDGTMTLYDYALGADGTRTTSIRSGQPNTAGTKIVDGALEVAVAGKFGQPLSRTSQDILSGKLLAREVYGNFDEFQRPRLVTYLDGSREETHYSCCGVSFTVDRQGVTTDYQYDALRRRTSSTRQNITRVTVPDAIGNPLLTIRYAAGQPPVIERQANYNTAGHLLAETNALGGVTRFQETRDAAGRLVRTTVDPLGGTRVETYFRDGQLRSVTGSAVFPVRYEYGVELDPTSPGLGLSFTKEIKLNASGADTPEWINSYVDPAGRTVYQLFPDRTASTLGDNPIHQQVYDAGGRLIRQVDPDGVVTLYSYLPTGEPLDTAVDVNRNGIIDFDGSDRITRRQRDVTSLNGVDVRRSRTSTWNDANTSASTLVSTEEISTDGLTSWRRIHEGSTTLTTRSHRTLPVNGAHTVTFTNPDGSSLVRDYSGGRLIAQTRRDAAGNPIGRLDCQYDPHGRLWKVTDARNGTAVFGYNAADLLTSVTTPAPGQGEAPQVTLTHYDLLGRADVITQPDGTVVSNTYAPSGLLLQSLGGRAYPVQYGYDAQGRMISMTTWQDASMGTGLATTLWSYDPRRGWLTRKSHHGEGDITDDYEYSRAGRLSRRLWERGLTTTYAYSSGGDLERVDYSDATPDLALTYDRRGRRRTVAQSGVITTLSYSNQDRPTAESWSGGSLNGLVVSLDFDSFLRKSLVSVNTAVPIQNAFAYDGASRLSRVWRGGFSADYGYEPNSSLVATITFQQHGATRLNTTRVHDALGRLTSIRSTATAPGPWPVAFDYQYDRANQRTKAALGDGTAWEYEYDELGQLTAGRRVWNDGSLIPGQQLHYQFDDIGNRVQTRTGGDQQGANLRPAAYSYNPLNQVISRNVPDTIDVLGIAHPQAGVTVNTEPASYRRGEYFQHTVPVPNAAGPVWQGVAVAACNGSSATTWPAGSVFVPNAGETFSYDADGNLTRDGRWNFTWDGENRLVRMVAATSVGPQLRLEFNYDWMGRRVGKKVWNNTTGTGAPAVDLAFVYDGWNLLAELHGTTRAIIRSYVWGLDLSGTEQGAGGIGGLLYVVPANGSAQAVACDGTGNVAALVDAGTGTYTARYEQGPFGEPIRVTGSQAASNPFRFSTKFADEETGLVYYGYRARNDSPGRWLQRESTSQSVRHPAAATSTRVEAPKNAPERERLSTVAKPVEANAGISSTPPATLLPSLDTFRSTCTRDQADEPDATRIKGWRLSSLHAGPPNRLDPAILVQVLRTFGAWLCAKVPPIPPGFAIAWGMTLAVLMT